jgi:hypothetical protein
MNALKLSRASAGKLRSDKVIASLLPRDALMSARSPIKTHLSSCSSRKDSNSLRAGRHAARQTAQGLRILPRYHSERTSGFELTLSMNLK